MIWVLFPAFNEAEALPKLLPKVNQALIDHGEPFQMVVVDDGSTDSTAEVLAGFANELPLSVISHPINRGLGETERDGFEYMARESADGDIIVRVESDDTHEPEYVLQMIEKLGQGFDVVNTSRFQPGGGQVGVDGYRAIVSRMANLFMHTVFRIPGLRDYSCGFRAYRAEVVKDAVEIYGNNFIQLRGLGFTSTLEMIVKLHMLGCRFAEVPFVLRYDQKVGYSKMVSSITSLGYLIMAVLYHWPFGGWRSQYRGLSDLYRRDRQSAVNSYSFRSAARRAAAKISL